MLDGGQMGRWEWDLQTDSMFWCQRVYDLLGLDARHAGHRARPSCRGSTRRMDRRLDVLIQKTLTDQTDLQAEFRVDARLGEDAAGRSSGWPCGAK